VVNSKLEIFMTRLIVPVLTLALLPLAARADDKADLTAAINKLADAPSYTWTTASDSPFGRGAADGKFDKATGLFSYIVEMGETTYQVLAKGEKAVIKGDTAWQTPAELAAAGAGGEGFNPALFVALIVENTLAPADQFKAWLPKLENIKKTGDTYTADLAPDAAKDLLSLRRKNSTITSQMPPMDIASPKASLKITVTDGTVTKIENSASGTITFGDNQNEFARTVTHSLKDLGTTKLTPPEDAQMKLAAAPAATAPATK
jgi:hypothetical protein